MIEKLSYASFAAIVYGGWAFYSNYDSPTNRAVAAGLVQAFCSFTITLTLAVLSIRAYRFLGFSSVIRAFLLVLLGFTSVMLVAHWMVGTEHIISSVIPSVIMGGIFCFYTINTESRAHGSNK